MCLVRQHLCVNSSTLFFALESFPEEIPLLVKQLERGKCDRLLLRKEDIIVLVRNGAQMLIKTLYKARLELFRIEM